VFFLFFRKKERTKEKTRRGVFCATRYGLFRRQDKNSLRSNSLSFTGYTLLRVPRGKNQGDGYVV
jgi:hypothetical protein